MRIAGVGLRAGATEDSLLQALALAGGVEGLAAFATIEDKAAHPALRFLAQRLSLPILALPRARIAGLVTPSHSARIHAGFGTGSVAEGCALAAAGPGARLITPRILAPDRRATLALAEAQERDSPWKEGP